MITFNACVLGQGEIYVLSRKTKVCCSKLSTGTKCWVLNKRTGECFFFCEAEVLYAVQFNFKKAMMSTFQFTAAVCIWSTHLHLLLLPCLIPAGSYLCWVLHCKKSQHIWPSGHILLHSWGQMLWSQWWIFRGKSYTMHFHLKCLLQKLPWQERQTMIFLCFLKKIIPFGH